MWQTDGQRDGRTDILRQHSTPCYAYASRGKNQHHRSRPNHYPFCAAPILFPLSRSHPQKLFPKRCPSTYARTPNLCMYTKFGSDWLGGILELFQKDWFIGPPKSLQCRLKPVHRFSAYNSFETKGQESMTRLIVRNLAKWTEARFNDVAGLSECLLNGKWNQPEMLHRFVRGKQAGFLPRFGGSRWSVACAWLCFRSFVRNCVNPLRLQRQL